MGVVWTSKRRRVLTGLTGISYKTSRDTHCPIYMHWALPEINCFYRCFVWSYVEERDLPDPTGYILGFRFSIKFMLNREILCTRDRCFLILTNFFYIEYRSSHGNNWMKARLDIVKMCFSNFRPIGINPVNRSLFYKKIFFEEEL